MKKTPSASRFQRCFLPLLIVLIILAILYSTLKDNFHVVVPNKVYRSAQLSPTKINGLLKLKNIKTILNLRGENPHQNWYNQEVRLAASHHLHYYTLALNSKTLPTKKQLQTLAHLIQAAPKPMLIHCLSGADRTGLASAMSKILLENAPLKEAKKQFSWRYYVIANQSIGKLVFNDYQQWLTQQHTISNRNHFVQWVYSPHPIHSSVNHREY